VNQNVGVEVFSLGWGSANDGIVQSGWLGHDCSLVVAEETVVVVPTSQTETRDGDDLVSRSPTNGWSDSGDGWSVPDINGRLNDLRPVPVSTASLSEHDLDDCLSSEWSGWNGASDGVVVDDDGVGSVHVVDHADCISVARDSVLPLGETSTLDGDDGVGSVGHASVETPDGSNVEDLRSPSPGDGGSGGVASIEVDIDVLVGVGSCSPQGLDVDGSVTTGGGTLTVDSTESNADVVGQQRISKTDTLDGNWGVGRRRSSWSDWSLSWAGGGDDWSISVITASQGLGLVLGGIEVQSHGCVVSKVSVGTVSITRSQAEVGGGGGSSSGRSNGNCTSVLFPVAASADTRNTESWFEGLASPIGILETNTDEGHGLESTQITESWGHSGASGSPVVWGGGWVVGVARSIEEVVDGSVDVPGVGWNCASEGGLTVGDGSVTRGDTGDVEIANVVGEQGVGGATNLVTGEGCRGLD